METKNKNLLNKPNFDEFERINKELSLIKCPYKVDGNRCRFGKEYNTNNRFDPKNQSLYKCTKINNICPMEEEEKKLRKEEENITLIDLLKRIRKIEHRLDTPTRENIYF